jgi:quinol monooxygenase YgiN
LTQGFDADKQKIEIGHGKHQYTVRSFGGCVVAVVWQFDIRPEASDDFERLYGADGIWTKLSRRSRSFLGSSFLRGIGSENRYLLVEYWGEMMVYEKHLADLSEQVKAIEEQRARLVERMETVGVFTALDVPDRVGPTWSRRSGK